jgi:hypothetical protein
MKRRKFLQTTAFATVAAISHQRRAAGATGQNQILHIHNGSLATSVVEASGLPGEHLVWREVLLSGPTPYGLSPTEWGNVRSQFLFNAYGLDSKECLAQLTSQQAVLQSYSSYDEVVLWFDMDLFCQSMLLFMLNWFAKQDLSNTRLSMVNVGSSTNFALVNDLNALCRMDSVQISPLFDQRVEVTNATLNLGTNAWSAYCSPNPESIQPVISGDTSALPVLKDNLLGHLARFPSVRNGLGRVENRALELINSGIKNFTLLCSEFEKAEPVYGFGNLQLFNELRRIANVPQPLLVISDVKQKPLTTDAGPVIEASLEITETGRAVMNGQKNFITLNGIDLWLGGVHLESNKPGWQWDEHSQTLQAVTIRHS